MVMTFFFRKSFQIFPTETLFQKVMTFFLVDISKSPLVKIHYFQIYPCKNTPKSVMTFFLVTTSKFSPKSGLSLAPLTYLYLSELSSSWDLLTSGRDNLPPCLGSHSKLSDPPLRSEIFSHVSQRDFISWSRGRIYLHHHRHHNRLPPKIFQEIIWTRRGEAAG